MEGKLKHWNEDKGFGFISSTDSQDVFIHISALKNMSRRPKVGDTITFEIHTDNKGKKRATNAKIHGVAAVNSKIKNNYKKPKSNDSNGWLITVIFLVLIVVAGYSAYKRYLKQKIQAVSSNESITSINIPVKKARKSVKENFSCGGKTHCSEMTSCEEAKYYLNNCPGTIMDGDGDGLPCERQWCHY